MKAAGKKTGMEYTPENRKLPTKILEEELNELLVALEVQEENNDIDIRSNILKEMCDVLYTIHFYCLSFGWSFESAYTEVCNSNMSKFPCTYDENGKVQKGPNYKPPSLEDCV